MNRKLAYAFLLSAVTLFAGGLPGRAANAQDTGTGEAATGPKQASPKQASPKEAGTKAAAIGPQQVVDHLANEAGLDPLDQLVAALDGDAGQTALVGNLEVQP